MVLPLDQTQRLDAFSKGAALYSRGVKTHKVETFKEAAELLTNVMESVELLDYLLINKKVEFPKKHLLDCIYKLAWCYKYQFELASQQAIIDSGVKTKSIVHPWTNNQEELFQIGLKTFNTYLQLSVDHLDSLKAVSSLFSMKALLHQSDYRLCCQLFQTALSYHPTDPTTHYNIGFIFFKMNRLNEGLYHYKLGCKLAEHGPENFKTTVEQENIIVNCYYGMACVYSTVKQWPQALHYLLQGCKFRIDDPDINNKLGVIYTELRRTDLAKGCYSKALANYKSSTISTDLTFFHAEINLNMGHMHAYNGNIVDSITFYNKALAIHPGFLLAFQNKIMNLNYLCHDIPNGIEYISQQHFLIQKILPESTEKLNVHRSYDKIVVGLVSGDFVDHPVSYFIRGMINGLDRSRYKIVCYSESVIKPNTFKKSVESRIIKNISDIDVTQMVRTDGVHILFDLSGHTALNRLGVFAARAAPIQISYIGYPNTTGMANMDYRITDSVADCVKVSQKYYSEQLVDLDRCFLNYTSDTWACDRPEPIPSPYQHNGFITFGCFNRLNKIGSSVIQLWKILLEKYSRSRIVFKTKALLNPVVKHSFLEQFKPNMMNRIDIVDCTVTHDQHLEEYNKIDVSIDTFPYSGTTTTCESLSMGVPVVTIRDPTTFFHAQNVSASILCHSGFDKWVFDSIDNVSTTRIEQWLNNSDLKREVSHQFKNGNVCNSTDFCKKIDTTFTKLVEQSGS